MRVARPLLLVLILLGRVAGSSAQETPSSGDAAEAPAANPGRPTVTTPATLTPVGYLQFENGVIGAWRSPEFTARVGLAETIKLAVTDRVQLLGVTDPAARYTENGRLGTGLADYFVGGQLVLHAGSGANPTVAASYLRRVYDGPAPEPDIGSPIDSVILLGSLDLGKFHLDTNVLFNRMSQDAVHRAQFGQTLSVSHTLPRKLGVAAEVYHVTQPYLHEQAVDVLAAATYTPRKSVVVDAGFNRGLTGTSTQWEAFAGFTYLLPHRLWPQRAGASAR